MSATSGSGVGAPWVVTKEMGRCLCMRCGEEYAIALPCRISVFVAAMRAFIKEHSACVERTLEVKP